jgi:hypothetical protein
VEEGLGIALAKDESEALAAILTRQPVIEWNHQLEKPEDLLGQFCGKHTGIVRNTDVFGHLVEVLT